MRTLLSTLLLFSFLSTSATEIEAFDNLCEEVSTDAIAQEQEYASDSNLSSDDCPDRDCSDKECEDCHCFHQHRYLGIKPSFPPNYVTMQFHSKKWFVSFYKQPVLEPSRKPPKST
jgi:hypothetical protein